ncbi:hypothetical protein OG21DRAFT_1501910 [Imleria badia]|nr:hypothetical protein OG21DRAFT_1501910 [Imleria badia]
MSTTSTSDDPNLQTTPPALVHTPVSLGCADSDSDTQLPDEIDSTRQLNYAVTHVFLPAELPHSDDYTLQNDLSLARTAWVVAQVYSSTDGYGTSEPQWPRITMMLENLQASIQSEHLGTGHVISQLGEMQTGDILVFFIRCQNAAVVLTKGENCTLCESFEVSPSSDAVEETSGSLLCSYPWSAIETPNEVFDDEDFRFELANFLSRPNAINLDLLPPPSPPPYRRYITALLACILRGGGRTVNVPRITKHVRDNVRRWPWDSESDESQANWNRSSLWLFIRVLIQTSVDRSPLGRASYKRFMLCFICALAIKADKANLSSDMLHLMSFKILRRLSKLGSSSTDAVSELALQTSIRLRETLDSRWKELSTRVSPFRNPSQDELARDTKVSLLDSREYIRSVLANPNPKSVSTSFHPSHRRRGTIEDFLSSNGSFFDKVYYVDPDVTLYDVEKSIEEGIDDWLARVTDVDEACEQLEVLMDQYMMKGYYEAHVHGMKDYYEILGINFDKTRLQGTEEVSIIFLTAIEFFVALDKLAVKEIPMLADYPPEIPIAFLEGLLLRKKTSLHRLSCAYQYLSARHSRSHQGWSVLSTEFTEDSFPVRYYDQSMDLQYLKARIEKEESPLPALLIHAKVVVFELQCPACIRIWRSAVARLVYCFHQLLFGEHSLDGKEGCTLLAFVNKLSRYFTETQSQTRQHGSPPLGIQIHFALFDPESSHPPRNSPMLRYVVQHPNVISAVDDTLSIWRPKLKFLSFNLSYRWDEQDLAKYIDYTSHTSNDVLSAQADCPADLSLDEFVAFGHLRSGGSLQWLNILRGLCSRTLNFRRHGVHFLVAHAVSQVGPLDLNTGVWIWHQELQDSSFCNALLDELDSLFVHIGAGTIDGVLMNTICLLLTRVLASSPSEGVAERSIALLRNVRRKTFKWVQELSYDLEKAPTNEERRNRLLDLASTCRSTFDVDPATLHNLFHSAEDVDALLSCAFFISALRPKSINDRYSRLLLGRDICLCPALEDILRDVILSNASDYGVDLAVRKIFPSYQPGAHRWEQLLYPNSRWLTYEAEETVDQPLQTVHINLLDGTIRVNGQQLNSLPLEIRESQECQKIFRDQGLLVIPSSLPGMDFTTFATRSEHKVHFSQRDNNLVLRAHGKQTNEVLELIPSIKFKGDLPPALVDGYVHWLNLTTKTIEIRPLQQLWGTSPKHWRTDCASGQYRIHKGHETLVDIRSPTWAMFSKCFECLNTVDDEYLISTLGALFDKDFQPKSWSRNLLIYTSPIGSDQSMSAPRLSVALPRYDLSFFVNEREELESRDFKDMVYDENQCIGALFGLENLLVLRQKTHLAGVLIPETVIQRRVLIPNGCLQEHGDHKIRIDVGSHSRKPGEPLYYTYNVDTELGCLVGDGSPKSTRLLAYAHAMTSWHRPDPLTCKTGAQAALCLLQSAEFRSIMKLKAFVEPWPVTTRYPQIDAAYSRIKKGYYWDRHYEADSVKRPLVLLEKPENAARRAAYLFPPNATGPTSLEDCNEHSPREITLHQLFRNRSAPELPARSFLLRDSHNTSSDDISALDQLFSSLRPDPSFQREYLVHLDASAQYVRMESRMTHRVVGENLVEELKKHYARCRANYVDSLDILKKSLGPTTDPYEQSSDRFGQWPPITADVLLRYLASTSPIDIPPHWKNCLTSLALLLLDLQRARRLLRFSWDGLEEEFSKELENEGCDGWNPEEYPDWLLIQVQGNFLIRRAQVETAMEIMSPRSGENTLTQVNMGEGKSSVIIPIAAAVLADGKQLVRIVVPKALTVQMFDLLVSRLSRLTNRPIYHLPFSRTPDYDYRDKVISLQIDDLHKLMSKCMTERGILLVQPEHVMSLKLMSVEEQIRAGKLTSGPLLKHAKLIYKYIKTALLFRSLPRDGYVASMFRVLGPSPDTSSKKENTHADHHGERGSDAHGGPDSASKWLSLQKWLHSHARDILDESDEILHPRFQLVYTLGPKQYMDGYPDRWTITQQVLRLAKRHLCSLSRYAPDTMEYEHGPPGSFPRVHIVRASDVGRHLISSITEDVMAGWIPDFNFKDISPELHDAIRSFISDEDMLQVPDTAKRVQEYAKQSDQSRLWTGLLLLRGLLTSRTLLFALAERRWRVDYGLVPGSQWQRRAHRSTTPIMLAVPYRAKDVPAPNTQFGHPDLTIILTCLSYYYAGLSEEQLRVSFEILLDQDDPSVEYALWIKEYDRESVPDSLRNFSEINLRSSEQWDTLIFPLFAWNQAAVDFYLARAVFPQEAKEFPLKLSGSSWDLAEKREKLITGFSGTNDGRWLLPMSIAQRDLDHQKGSNAKVLAYLLQPENDFYIVTHESGERWTTRKFLHMVASQLPQIRVLLDVGAQILDLSNLQLARAWLRIAHDATGAIYFNNNNELMVLSRSGISQPMMSSPLSRQLDRCVVYLDHAHTRGTDIKLPIGSRGGVTLGPKVTKDALVQGCMRMRKLGHSHSVMFFAPPEVDRSIRALAGKKEPNTQVTTVDILRWAIQETWTDIHERAPYWAQQGMNHKSKYDAWSWSCDNELAPEQLSDAWIQPELKSLADLYAPCESKNAQSNLSALDPGIRQRCKDLGVLSLPGAQMEEEQKREVNREQEREREVELPPKTEPAEHYLHPDVVAFVKTGNILPLLSGNAFLPIFTSLEMSSAATREADVWSPFILATADFCRTIKPESTRGTIDQYLQPVQWILSNKGDRDQVLILLSPFEADRLMPDIRTSESVHLHVYAPRTSQRMKPSDDLRLYSIPPLPSDWNPPWALIDQLNVFSGQLCLRDYASYLRLCRFLDVPTKELPNNTATRRNLFNIPGGFEEMEITFSGSPLPSVMALLAIRNRGLPFAQTHMGRILQGHFLTEKDF